MQAVQPLDQRLGAAGGGRGHQAAPEAGEEEALASLRATMQAGARLGDELAVIMALIQGSEGGLAQLRQAARRLDRIANEHEALADALSALDRAVIEAAEAEGRGRPVEAGRVAVAGEAGRVPLRVPDGAGQDVEWHVALEREHADDRGGHHPRVA